MYKIYQVEYGDTLDIIANKTNTTVDNIKDINGFNSDADLMVGNLIIVPNMGEGLFTTYRVMQGDNMYAIAGRNNVSLETLLLLNGLNKDDYIYPNQEILIPKENIDIYITKEGDTLDTLLNNFNVDANKLNKENSKIFVLPDQLIINKKEKNN